MKFRTKIIHAAFILGTALLAVPAQSNTADLIAYGDYVLTMQPDTPVIVDGAIAVADDRIIAVGTRASIDARYIATRSLSGNGRILMPGLINGHTHTSMTLFRGMVDDLKLMTWLNDYIFPMEGRFVTPEFVRTGSTLACWEMIRGGTTTFVDMYFYPDEIAGVVDRCGLRVGQAQT